MAKNIFEDNYAIGVDMENISRFLDLKPETIDNFFAKVFTNQELEYCFAHQNAAQHLAARFAAKEAVIKAFGNIGIEIFYNEIEISNHENGSPFVGILKSGFDDYMVKISFSHAQDMVVAFSIIQKN